MTKQEWEALKPGDVTKRFADGERFVVTSRTSYGFRIRAERPELRRKGGGKATQPSLWLL